MRHSFAVLILAFAVCAAHAADSMKVGSKRFTESYILGEIVAQTVNQAGEARAVHKQGLGNTAILFAALKSSAIDLYPEYAGTIAFELLGLKSVPSLDKLNELLAPHGLMAAVPLGFNNTYAMAMNEQRAAALNVRSISDLAKHPTLRLGLSQEFLNRKDGWPALNTAYGFSLTPTGLDHGLAYEALRRNQIDVLDVYSTDAKIARDGLRVLTDDRRFFPSYDALLIVRNDLPQRFPRSWQALKRLEGRIDAPQMIAMNGAAELDGKAFAPIAEAFLRGTAATASIERNWWTMLFGADFWRLTVQHLTLVAAALALSIAAGIPLGIWAAQRRKMRPWILGVAGVLQTIPALALLAFLIAALDQIGTVPAIISLFLYGLLPIVRNAESGLSGIPDGLRQAGSALGLPKSLVLRRIELPLALPVILAGVKTSAVINVGTATIAAFIGAGGYGERIVAGLAVNDHGLMLAGAIPAAALALLIQGGFDLAERKWLSYGLVEHDRSNAAN